MTKTLPEWATGEAHGDWFKLGAVLMPRCVFDAHRGIRWDHRAVVVGVGDGGPDRVRYVLIRDDGGRGASLTDPELAAYFYPPQWVQTVNPNDEPVGVYSRSYPYLSLARRPICTSHVYPPIPPRKFDWCAWFDAEGEEAGHYGYGPTEEEAVQDLLDNYEWPK